MRLAFEIQMAPVARKNPKPGKKFVGKDEFGRPKFRATLVKDDDETIATETFMALAIPHAPPRPFDGPVRVILEFRRLLALGRAGTWEGDAARAGLVRPTEKPDVDNHVKFTFDALTHSGRFWRDDSQVVELVARKVFADAPSVRVEIEELEHVASARAWRERLARSADALAHHAPEPPAAAAAPIASRTPDLFGP